MGNASKIVLVGAASLVVGVYTVSLKREQTINLMASISSASTTQSVKVGDAALRASLYRVQFNRDADSVSVYTVTSTMPLPGGGTYTYSFPCYKNQTTAIWGTVTLNLPNSDQRIMDVRIDKVGVTSVTSPPITSPLPYTKPGFRHYVRGKWQITEVHYRDLD